MGFVEKSLQGIFEGLKACRKENGRLLLFRPDQNAIRMQIGAERMCMPAPSIDQFVDAVTQTVAANKRWVIFLLSGKCRCFTLIEMHVQFVTMVVVNWL